MKFKKFLLLEKIINVDTKVIISKIINLKNNILTSKYEDALSLIKLTLSMYKISFEKSTLDNEAVDEYLREAGIITAEIFSKSGKIIIYIDEKQFKKNFSSEKKLNIFLVALDRVLSHELVHQEQLKRVNWKNVKNVALMDSMNIKDLKKYLSDKQEIMAFAKQTSVEFLQHELTFEEILSALKNPSKNPAIIELSTIMSLYMDTFETTEKEWKLYMKYVYQYICDFFQLKEDK